MTGLLTGIDEGYLILKDPDRLLGLLGRGDWCSKGIGDRGKEILLFRILGPVLFELLLIAVVDISFLLSLTGLLL